MALLKKTLQSAAVSVMCLGAVSMATTLVTVDVAYAKGEKSGGKGGDRGNSDRGGDRGKSGDAGDRGKSDKGRDKSDRSAKSSGKSKTEKSKGFASKRSGDRKGGGLLRDLFGGKSKQAKASKPAKVAKKQTVKVAAATSKRPPKQIPAARQSKPKLSDILGVHPSQLGALNAANASPNAFANASPNSRVGKLGAYRDAVIAGRALETELANAEAELGDLTPPTRPSTEIATDLQVASDKRDAFAEVVDALETEIASSDDPTLAEALGKAQDDLAAAQAEADALQNDLADAQAYEDKQQEVADLTEEAATNQQDQADLLDAAANKEVTPEVEATVQAMLGLDEEAVE